MVSNIAVVCSIHPGFLRRATAALQKQFQIVECATLPELTAAMLRYRVSTAVIDLDGMDYTSLRNSSEVLNDCQTYLVTTCADRAAVASQNPDWREKLVHSASHEQLTGDLQALFDNCCQAGDPKSATVPRCADGVPELHNGVRNDSAKCPENGQPANTPAPPSVPALRFHTHTPAVQDMLNRLAVAARHHVTLLLIGETGSGKTHLARQIHEASSQRHQPFLHVACGALPAELIASELFGHVKGAFTSAHADKDGKFLAAGNGTLLLDEIDVLTPEQQVNLLRVIETGEFEPVGSNQTLKLRARIIAASNLDLQPLVESGRFRPDLYYRLNMLKFEIPPLRKRRPDVEPLARHFIQSCAEKHSIRIESIEPGFLDALLQYPWPGNVRELENAVRSAVIYASDGVLAPADLPQHVVACIAGPAGDPSVSAFLPGRKSDSLGNRLELTERDIIHDALMRNRFSRTKTAKDLGISRVTLYNKMKKYEIVASA